MAHFAQIDENNKVVQVVVIETRHTSTPDGTEKESIGAAYCEHLFGGKWVKTSYNTLNGEHLQGGTPFRGNFAGVGYTYDENNNIFYPPQPYPSWTIAGPNWRWIPPTPRPNDSKIYHWNEDTKNWDLDPIMPRNHD